MSETKGFLDTIFDAAEGVLTPMEKVLKEDAIDADFVDHPDPKPEDETANRWEKQWEEPKWAVALGAWHVFPENSLKANCSQEFKSHEIKDRQALEHSKVISACTSCIISVTK